MNLYISTWRKTTPWHILKYGKKFYTLWINDPIYIKSKNYAHTHTHIYTHKNTWICMHPPIHTHKHMHIKLRKLTGKYIQWIVKKGLLLC